MFNNLLETNINFYNYILAKQKLFNTQTNFSYLNILNPANSAEIKEAPIFPQSSETIQDLKINKLNFDDLNKFNTICTKTNRDFYKINSINKRNKGSNFIPENLDTINYKQNNNAMNDLFISYNSQKRKNNISYVNNNSSKFLYEMPHNSNIKNKYNRNNILKHSITEKKMIINYSKIIYNFKNMKMFYAHLELLISLYLKRNYNYFIQQIKNYGKMKVSENNLNLYNTTNNQNQPIINLNNAHCSLYYSININKDTNSNNETINNNNNQNQILKNVNINKNIVNKIQKINNMLNTKNEIYTNKKQKNNINKTVYVPKNNANKLKKMNPKNKNNNIKKSSPIKEMNIDLKRMNKNANKANNNSNSNLKNEKTKSKISKTNSSIYKRPKDNTSITKKTIKEIKILNKEIVLTPLDNKTKTIFENSNQIKKSTNIKENKTIKKVYIRKNNFNENKDIIKTTLFRNNSDLTKIKSFTNFIKNKPREMLIKKIITADKRIFININYIIFDYNDKYKTKNKFYLQLKEEYTISLAIIKNTLLIQENINQNIIFSDIFTFDNDKNIFSYNKKEKYNRNISLLNFVRKIKDIMIKFIRKYLLNNFKKYIYLKRIINGNNNKILNHYLKKFFQNKNNTTINSGVYHKINYNDDFNLTKKIKPIINKEKNNYIQFKKYQNNISLKNNKNIIFRNKNKNQSSINFSKTYKYWNKEINITVHENKENKINKKSTISSYNKK